MFEFIFDVLGGIIDVVWGIVWWLVRAVTPSGYEREIRYFEPVIAYTFVILVYFVATTRTVTYEEDGVTKQASVSISPAQINNTLVIIGIVWCYICYEAMVHGMPLRHGPF